MSIDIVINVCFYFFKLYKNKFYVVVHHIPLINFLILPFFIVIIVFTSAHCADIFCVLCVCLCVYWPKLDNVNVFVKTGCLPSLTH